MKSIFSFTAVAVVLWTSRVEGQATPGVRVIDTVVTAGASGRIRATNTLGNIVVHGWDRADVRIRINLTSADHIGIGRPLDVLEIRRQSRATSTPSNLELWVPRKSAVELHNRDGSIEISDTEGPVMIRGALADVTARGLRGALTVGTSVGRIQVFNSSGSMQLTTSAGGVSVAGATGSVRVETSAGDISVSAISSERLTALTERGSVTYGGLVVPGAQHELSSHSGEVSIALDSSASVTVYARALRGRILHHGVRSTKRDDGLDIIVGKGTASIRVNTFSGVITVGPQKPKGDK